MNTDFAFGIGDDVSFGFRIDGTVPAPDTPIPLNMILLSEATTSAIIGNLEILEE